MRGRRRVASASVMPTWASSGSCVGDTRQRGVVDPRRQAEQGAADDDAGVVGADMGEGARADALRIGDVAHRIDAPVGQAAQSAIGGDAEPAGLHIAGRRGPAPPGSVAVRPRPANGCRRSAVPSCSTSVGPGSTARTVAPSKQRDAARREAVAQSGDQFGVLACRRSSRPRRRSRD